LKILTVVGARPQFVKAAAVSRALRGSHEELLVHTGQHYDYAMSGVFFDGLDLPQPAVNLGVGSGRHGAQTGAMLAAIEELVLIEQPDWLLTYGDTNSTLAAAVAASKAAVPVAHIEAGLRSFNRRMPEEINRVVADHLSDVLLCPSRTAVKNLASEGIWKNVHLVGDVMLDVLEWARQRMEGRRGAILERLGLTPKSYVLATVHRAATTDCLDQLLQILNAFNTLDECVVFPVHPRTRRAMTEGGAKTNTNVRVIDPVDYLEMLALSESSRMILTDSGGLQKEAYWLGVPCLTLRDETEWVETVEMGWNKLVGTDTETIVESVRDFAPAGTRPALYGDGRAASRCVALLAGQQPAMTDAVINGGH
jgi:UDP-N-acetylglucosamine 2-epimerase